jgi:methyl-accepting chemotaxis protein
MEIREFWSKIKNWMSSEPQPEQQQSDPALDDDGLMTKDVEEAAAARKDALAGNIQNVPGQLERYEKIQNSLNRFIDKLQVMNNNLEQQLKQHRVLTEKLEEMPELVKNFPSMVENQEKIRTQLAEQIADMQSKNEQFVEAVERIPAEMGRQTDLLEEIKEQLSIKADAEDNMASGFRKFNDILARLNQNTLNHTDSIMQMSKTFSTSEKFLKYVISRQNKQFIWLFAVSLSVCFVAIAVLAGIIVYLSRPH